MVWLGDNVHCMAVAILGSESHGPGIRNAYLAHTAHVCWDYFLKALVCYVASKEVVIHWWGPEKGPPGICVCVCAPDQHPTLLTGTAYFKQHWLLEAELIDINMAALSHLHGIDRAPHVPPPPPPWHTCLILSTEITDALNAWKYSSVSYIYHPVCDNRHHLCVIIICLALPGWVTDASNMGISGYIKRVNIRSGGNDRLVCSFGAFTIPYIYAQCTKINPT